MRHKIKQKKNHFVAEENHAGKKSYDKNFFAGITDASVNSAKKILPVIKKFISPASVIDIGCGQGGWLSVWQEDGAEIFGIDGDYVDRSEILIDEKFFRSANLEDAIIFDKKFDLAMTLEVAEHLKPERAESFIEDLTKLSDVVMFSAAIPGQGGTNHVNENWQSHWAEKFSCYGYVAVDCIRPEIWFDTSISEHYRQNILIYVKSSALPNYPALEKYYFDNKDRIVYDVVHPQVWFDMLVDFGNLCQKLQTQIKTLSKGK